MKEYLESPEKERNPGFFELLKVQVSCFGNPNHFYYDDVSQVKATGKQTDPNQYSLNVSQSLPYQKRLFDHLKPEIILIGGAAPFDAYCSIILPELNFDNLTLVKLRNPSPQAHRGNRIQWIKKYRSFTASLPNNKGLQLFHLKCSNINSQFELCKLSTKRYLK